MARLEPTPPAVNNPQQSRFSGVLVLAAAALVVVAAWFYLVVL